MLSAIVKAIRYSGCWALLYTLCITSLVKYTFVAFFPYKSSFNAVCVYDLISVEFISTIEYYRVKIPHWLVLSCF